MLPKTSSCYCSVAGSSLLRVCSMTIYLNDVQEMTTIRTTIYTLDLMTVPCVSPGMILESAYREITPYERVR